MRSSAPPDARKCLFVATVLIDEVCECVEKD